MEGSGKPEKNFLRLVDFFAKTLEEIDSKSYFPEFFDKIDFNTVSPHLFSRLLIYCSDEKLIEEIYSRPSRTSPSNYVVVTF